MSNQRYIEVQNAIEQCKGAIATIWAYAASLSQLTIRITWPGRTENLHFVCNACSQIETFTSWGNADLAIHELGGDQYLLTDVKANFSVKCGMVRVMRNVEPIY